MSLTALNIPPNPSKTARYLVKDADFKFPFVSGGTGQRGARLNISKEFSGCSYITYIIKFYVFGPSTGTRGHLSLIERTINNTYYGGTQILLNAAAGQTGKYVYAYGGIKFGSETMPTFPDPAETLNPTFIDDLGGPEVTDGGATSAGGGTVQMHSVSEFTEIHLSFSNPTLGDPSTVFSIPDCEMTMRGVWGK